MKGCTSGLGGQQNLQRVWALSGVPSLRVKWYSGLIAVPCVITVENEREIKDLGLKRSFWGRQLCYKTRWQMMLHLGFSLLLKCALDLPHPFLISLNIWDISSCIHLVIQVIGADTSTATSSSFSWGTPRCSQRRVCFFVMVSQRTSLIQIHEPLQLVSFDVEEQRLRNVSLFC